MGDNGRKRYSTLSIPVSIGDFSEPRGAQVRDGDYTLMWIVSGVPASRPKGIEVNHGICPISDITSAISDIRLGDRTQRPSLRTAIPTRSGRTGNCIRCQDAGRPIWLENVKEQPGFHGPSGIDPRPGYSKDVGCERYTGIRKMTGPILRTRS
jgi:hypothetical protein